MESFSTGCAAHPLVKMLICTCMSNQIRTETRGLQWATGRNLLMARVLTLPAAMVLSGFLFWGFRNIV